MNRIIGRLLAWAFPLIVLFASNRVHGHIYDTNGKLYMGRWWVVKPGGWGSRLLRLFTGFESIRLHHINRPDNDRDLHNHPFFYRTFVLNGFYSEYRRDSLAQPVYWHPVFEGQSSTGSLSMWHRIDDVSPQGVWTFFCMGPNSNEWGFMTDDGYLESRAYFKRRGIRPDGTKETA